MTRRRPPADVLRAFRAAGPARPLAGGQGTSWIAGDVVLKPDGGLLPEWLAGALAGVEKAGFRVAMPVPTRTGAWVHAGWTATRWVAGHATTTAWPEVVEAGRAFHRAVAGLGRPAFLDARRDPWAEADRVAWGERETRFSPGFAEVARRLRGALEPLGRAQLVHGDLTGNVLLTQGLDPAIIDIAPYWRPPAYAEGIVVADALCWHGAPASLPADVGVPVAAVARALLFRMATDDERGVAGADRYGAAAAAIGV